MVFRVHVILIFIVATAIAYNVLPYIETEQLRIIEVILWSVILAIAAKRLQ